ncbi:MAG: hypothetical protein FJY83_06315 [Candidatus Aminicenantes bacterium]|nr:hypothetical protein [Candidatus Aminicenantes bacterium]
MKRTWRCFVCNDIHYGTQPPEVCPTCKVRRAYVEISSAEAGKACLPSPAPFTKDDFRRAIEDFAAKNEFQVNPDRERVATLIEGIFANEANHGLKYCPCRLATKDFAEDLKIVCPCNFLVHETYRGREKGACWCGLFVRR